MSCSGRAVVIGMGKSGHVANKVAAVEHNHRTQRPLGALELDELIEGWVETLGDDAAHLALPRRTTSDSDTSDQRHHR